MKLHFFFLFLLVSALSLAQQTDYVDFKTCRATLYIDLEKEKVFGMVDYTFDVLKTTDSIIVNSKNIDFDYVKVNDSELLINIDNSEKFSGRIFKKFNPSKNNILSIKYHVNPKKALYFVQKNHDVQVWTQGQGKYTSNWLPSLDDTNDKIEFDLSVVVDSDYQVISNGKLLNVEKANGYNTWHYDMTNPMSSYLVALAIGKYDKKVEYSKSSIPLEMYYYPEDSAKVEPTYRYSKKMFDFLETEIGVPYPWQNYKQVPVHDFLYAGMENTSCTIFSDAYMVDDTAFVDKNYVNINAHELAHQWFGNLVTAKSGNHHWLQEGFATYYALLAERDVFGNDYYYWRLYEYAKELLEQDKAGNSTSLLDPKSSSLTFYKKGAWVLHVLRSIVGDKTFKLAVLNYLNKHKFGNVETNDFISEVENVSGMDLSGFVDKWIISADNSFFEESIESLKQEKIYFLAGVMPLQCQVGVDIKEYTKKKTLTKKFKLTKNINSRTKVEFFKELMTDSLIDKIDLYKSAFQSNDIKLRQAIAQNLTEIPSELKEDYESLLDDKSYITIETALFKLWNNFPEDRNKYLEKTKNIIGFNDKNVRILWLVLALYTPGYQPVQSQDFYKELVSYTDRLQGFETRLKAFEYLLMTNTCNTTCQDNLKLASAHHNWRLAKFAKDQLKQININHE